MEVAHLDGLYPDGRTDEEAEVARLLSAHRIVLQFPIQWYSTPPLLKAWQDLVLTRMFYVRQEEGARMAGRPLMVAATAGNRASAYRAEGANQFSVAELLRPLEAVAHRCGLSWQAPFVAYEAREASPEALEGAGQAYAARLRGLGGPGWAGGGATGLQGGIQRLR